MNWGNDDDVKRWREDADRREHERVEAKAQMQRDRERHERGLARASAHEEIAELRSDLATLYNTLRDVITATSDTLRTLGDEARTQRTAIDDLKLQVARLSASPEAKRTAFQFAREKEGAEVVEIPGFLPRKMVN
jgi:hypothetical protein